MNLDFNDFQDEVRRKNIAIEKSFDPFYIDPDQPLDIEKGKRAQVGEIRTHGGRKVQKQGDGSWKPVKENGWKERKTQPKGDSSGSDGGDLISGLKSMGFKKDAGSHGILSVGENEYSKETSSYQCVYNPKSKEITFADLEGKVYEEGKARSVEEINNFIKEKTKQMKDSETPSENLDKFARNVIWRKKFEGEFKAGFNETRRNWKKDLDKDGNFNGWERPSNYDSVVSKVSGELADKLIRTLSDKDKMGHSEKDLREKVKSRFSYVLGSYDTSDFESLKRALGK